MKIPVEIVVWVLGVITLLASGIITFALRFGVKLKEVIERNTEAIAVITTKKEGDDKLCKNKHDALDRTVQRHDKTLERHEELIIQLTKQSK